METNKYKLGEKHKEYELYRIIATINFLDVKAGDIGGYIAGEKNLSQSDNAWVFGDARVYGDAQVFGNAWVYGDLKIDYTPLNIVGLRYSITVFKKSGHIQAGCYLKTIKEWEDITVFEDQEFLDEWKDKILAFAR